MAKADPIYWNVTVVRGLLMKEEEPDKWAVLERMMDHNEERRAEEDEDGTFAMYKENVVQFLRVRCGLADRFSEEEVTCRLLIQRPLVVCQVICYPYPSRFCTCWGCATSTLCGST